MDVNINDIIHKTNTSISNEINRPYSYISSLTSNNNNIRSSFINAFNNLFFNIDTSSLESIISILHNSSLLIDDIEDNSPLRRGKPSAHLVFGAPLTINSANMMYLVAMCKVMELGGAGGAGAGGAGGAGVDGIGAGGTGAGDSHDSHNGVNLGLLGNFNNAARGSFDLNDLKSVTRDSTLIESINDSLIHLSSNSDLLLKEGNRLVKEEQALIERGQNLKEAKRGQGLRVSSPLNRPVAPISEMISEMINLHHGQGLDIYWRDNISSISLPSIQDYLSMVKDKTGGLFRLSIKLLKSQADKTQQSKSEKDSTSISSELLNQLLAIANLLGIIYQIRDDYLNLTVDYGKGVPGEDLIEGKLSLPILHCLITTTSSPVHDLIYKRIEKSTENVEKCINFMKSCGSLNYSKELLESYYKIVIDLLNESSTEFKNSSLEKIITKMCDLS